MSRPAQSFDSHARIVPGYHHWTAALIVLPTLYFLYRTLTDFSVERLALALFCVGVVLVSFYARFFPLGVQDRVIRLEERLRLERLLPPELRERIGDFSTDQLIGLRFASDEELPELARRVLDESLSDKNEIKRAVRSWQADHQRI